jgi:hypothetical protein
MKKRVAGVTSQRVGGWCEPDGIALCEENFGDYYRKLSMIIGSPP